ncbi:MAG TPA: prepilin-type N-terminal cleavage/methylation domain-containing protein [Planctomycetota bacterium]
MATRQCGKGFTVPELMMVVAIIAVLGMLLIGGYGNMQRTQRINNAAEKLTSMLYLARSLAITHNAVYHVRLDNSSPKQQAVGVYCYPSVRQAMQVTQDYGGPIYSGPNVLDDRTNPQAWSRFTHIRSEVTAGGATFTYQNYQVDLVKLDAGTFVGVQMPLNSIALVDKTTLPTSWTYTDPTTGSSRTNPCIYFLPDGTASSTMTFYVSDDVRLSDLSTTGATAGIPPTAQYTYSEINNTRSKFFDISQLYPVTRWDDRAAYPTIENNADATKGHHLPNSQVRLVQVFKGGNIKPLRGQQEVLPTK